MSVAPEARTAGRRLGRTARRQSLLHSAREIFVTQGYHATGMDDIAERAGVSKPVLYQHFAGKLELYLALLDAAADELEVRLRTALESTSDNSGRVTACIAAYFDYCSGASSPYPLILESDLRMEPAVRERVQRHLDIAVSAIAGTIAADTGAEPPAAQLLSVGLVGIAELSARWWLTSDRSMPQEEAVRLLAALAWRGIGGFPRAG